MTNGFPLGPQGWAAAAKPGVLPDLADVEVLDNGVRAMRCGLAREVIRVPAEIGVNACAFLRRARQQVGDVIADRDRHAYFMVPPKTSACWEALVQSAGAPAAPLALLTVGAIVVLPAGEGDRSRWLHGPTLTHTTPAADVLAAVRHAATI